MDDSEFNSEVPLAGEEGFGSNPVDALADRLRGTKKV
jgi:hypothetical protein